MTNVPFPFGSISYAFEAEVPNEWWLVTEREFGLAIDMINWNLQWHGPYGIYRDYNKTVGVHDNLNLKWFLNPYYFTPNLSDVLCGPSSPDMCQDTGPAIADGGKGHVAE